MTEKKSLVLRFNLDGQVYDLSPDDFTGADDLAVFRACGVTLMDVFRRRGMTAFTVAALIWRYRVNHGEPDLSYDEVNNSLTITDVVTSFESPEPPEGTPSPEA